MHAAERERESVYFCYHRPSEYLLNEERGDVEAQACMQRDGGDQTQRGGKALNPGLVLFALSPL